MTDLRKFEKEPKCDKCDGINIRKTYYTFRVKHYQHDPAEKIEELSCKCNHCGFSFEMECADAKK